MIGVSIPGVKDSLHYLSSCCAKGFQGQCLELGRWQQACSLHASAHVQPPCKHQEGRLQCPEQVLPPYCSVCGGWPTHCCPSLLL